MCVSKQKAIIWYDRTCVVAQFLVVVESKHNGVFPRPGFESQIIFILPAGGPGDEEHRLGSFSFVHCFSVRGEHLSALLIIKSYVNLRITSFSFFEQGDFS